MISWLSKYAMVCKSCENEYLYSGINLLLPPHKNMIGVRRRGSLDIYWPDGFFTDHFFTVEPLALSGLLRIILICKTGRSWQIYTNLKFTWAAKAFHIHSHIFTVIRTTLAILIVNTTVSKQGALWNKCRRTELKIPYISWFLTFFSSCLWPTLSNIGSRLLLPGLLVLAVGPDEDGHHTDHQED